MPFSASLLPKILRTGMDVASITRHNDRWRAQVFRGGIRRSKVFCSTADARSWAAAEELKLERGDADSAVTLGDVFDRYAREVSDSKRGARWEIIRLAALGRDRIARIAMRESRTQISRIGAIAGSSRSRRPAC